MMNNYKQVAQILIQANYSCYLVGGAVRDMLLGINPDDYDLATNANPQTVMEVYESAGITIHPTGLQHGTVTVIYNDEPIEITTFRTEGDYTDGRRPDSVEFVDDIVPDLARRDFTINAMAVNLVDGSLTDPFNGREDLEEGVIRAVGSAEERLLEDGLRAYRACRQAAKFNFEIDDELLAAIQQTNITQPAIERINTEFTKGLLYEKPTTMLNYLSVTGLLDNIVENYPANITDIGNKIEQAPNSIEVRLAIFLSPVKERADETLNKLRYPNKVIRKVLNYLDNYPGIDNDPNQLMRNVGRDNADDILEIYRIETEPSVYEDVQKGIQFILQEDIPLQVKDLEVDGSDVISLGVPQGRMVGIILNELLDRVIENPSLDQHEELERIIEENK
jgi:tRNA nucleotidyltransferase (CCA-adding enzyme)